MERDDAGSGNRSGANLGAVVVGTAEENSSGPPVEGDNTELGSQGSDAAAAAEVTEGVTGDPGGVMGDIQKVGCYDAGKENMYCLEHV